MTNIKIKRALMEILGMIVLFKILKKYQILQFTNFKISMKIKFEENMNFTTIFKK